MAFVAKKKMTLLHIAATFLEYKKARDF